MDRRPLYRRLLSSGILIGSIYGLSALLLGATPMGILLGVVCAGGLAAVMTWRQQIGQPLLPTVGLIVFGVAGVALNARSLAVGHWPQGREWIVMAFVFVFPTAILLMAVRQWRAQRLRSD